MGKTISNGRASGRVARSSKPKLQNCEMYPWERWFSAFTTVLRYGRDYLVQTRTMRQIIRNNASRLGVSVKTLVQKTDHSECIVIYPQLKDDSCVQE